MTLKGHYAPCSKTRASFGAHCENLNEDRLHYQWRQYSPVTLGSDNIRFMRIFAGVPWKGGVIQQWGNQKRVFSGLWTLRIGHLRKWGQWMTLNGLNGHFTLYVQYYEPQLTHYLLVIYCSLFITRVTNAWPAEKCGKRSSKQWSAEYLESTENLRIFRGRYIVRTLTNNANIIILYYLVPYRLSTDSKTRDFEWPWIAILR